MPRRTRIAARRGWSPSAGGRAVVIAGRIVKARRRAAAGAGSEVLVRDDAGGSLVCIWFHYRPSFLQRFPFLAHVLVSGEVKEGYRGGGQSHAPPGRGDARRQRRARRPARRRLVRSGGPGLHGSGRDPPRTFRRIEKRAVDEYVRFVGDALPDSLRRRRRLLQLPEALRETHFPDRFAGELARGVPSGEPRRRLAFEELFLVQLGLALRRRGVQGRTGHRLSRASGGGGSRRVDPALAADGSAAARRRRHRRRHAQARADEPAPAGRRGQRQDRGRAAARRCSRSRTATRPR